jgi:hypothetical protein
MTPDMSGRMALSRAPQGLLFLKRSFKIAPLDVAIGRIAEVE